jgi:hypothetical protein
MAVVSSSALSSADFRDVDSDSHGGCKWRDGVLAVPVSTYSSKRDGEDASLDPRLFCRPPKDFDAIFAGT